MEFLTQSEALDAYVAGKALQNRESQKFVNTYMFLGSPYASNENRKERYKFDSPYWCIISIPWYKKICQIITRKVHKVK